MVPPPFLPRNDGAIESYDFGPVSPYGTSHVGGFPRIVYAAAHVVADPLTSHDPWSDSTIDWETALAFRHHLWRLGLKIAEATDTSQRGMGLDWSMAKELIRRSHGGIKIRCQRVAHRVCSTAMIEVCDRRKGQGRFLMSNLPCVLAVFSIRQFPHIGERRLARACGRLQNSPAGKMKFLTLALLITAITTPCADLSLPDGSHDRHALRDRSGDF